MDWKILTMMFWIVFQSDRRANVWISYRKVKKNFIDIFLFCVSYGVKSSFYVELLFSMFDVS